MSPAELAALLDGREIRSDTTRTERRAAAAAGLVIIYGASDEAASDSAGTIELVHLDADRRYDGPKIEAVWLPDENMSWSIRTNLPHSQFFIFEDGEPFCRGIVVAMSDIAASLQAIHQAFPG